MGRHRKIIFTSNSSVVRLWFEAQQNVIRGDFPTWWTWQWSAIVWGLINIREISDVFGSSSDPEDAFTSISFTWNMFFSRRASWPARYLWWVWKIPGTVPYSVWSGEKCFWKKKCTVIPIFPNKGIRCLNDTLSSGYKIDLRIEPWLRPVKFAQFCFFCIADSPGALLTAT